MQETQKKVDVYARCYAYGDEISPCLKTLEEMRHLSVKEIHPHNLNMLEEQIEKAEKVRWWGGGGSGWVMKQVHKGENGNEMMDQASDVAEM